MKFCNKCGKEKVESEFGKCSFSLDGLYWSCKTCNREDGRKFRLERKKASGMNFGSTCSIIKKHHENMKNDSERLSTEFIQVLLGRRCK